MMDLAAVLHYSYVLDYIYLIKIIQKVGVGIE